MDDALAAQWRSRLETITRELAEWRLQHPEATFTEIEQAVDARMTAARAELLADLAHVVGLQSPAPPPQCATCQRPLQRRGKRRRRVRTTGDQAVTLERDYLVCPVCGDEVFPPG